MDSARRLRVERPDQEVVLETRESPGAAWGRTERFSVRDDTETGEYVVSRTGTGGVERKVIRYARDTGALRN